MLGLFIIILGNWKIKKINLILETCCMQIQFAASIDYTYKHSNSSAYMYVKTQEISNTYYEVNGWYIFLAH